MKAILTINASSWSSLSLPAFGKVNVAMLPHHSMFDSSSAATVRALAARNWVISGWHAAHPSIDVVERAFSTGLYAGERDIYTTALHPAAALTMGRLTRRFAGTDGHVVCRVSAGGTQYQMIVTDVEVKSASALFALIQQNCERDIHR